jgi:hypothetical protein
MSKELRSKYLDKFEGMPPYIGDNAFQEYINFCEVEYEKLSIREARLREALESIQKIPFSVFNAHAVAWEIAQAALAGG